jgi:hypothetical protein
MQSPMDLIAGPSRSRRSLKRRPPAKSPELSPKAGPGAREATGEELIRRGEAVRPQASRHPSSVPHPGDTVVLPRPSCSPAPRTARPPLRPPLLQLRQCCPRTSTTTAATPLTLGPPDLLPTVDFQQIVPKPSHHQKVSPFPDLHVAPPCMSNQLSGRDRASHILVWAPSTSSSHTLIFVILEIE